MTLAHKVQIAIFGLLYIGVGWAVWRELRNWRRNSRFRRLRELRRRLKAAVHGDKDWEGAA